MSNWFNGKRIRAKFVVLLLLCLVLASHASAKTACNDSFAVAIRLIHAFYQELQGKDVTIQIGAEQPFDADRAPSSFGVAVSEARPSEPITAAPYPQHLSSAERVGHLSIHFEFDPRANQLVLMSVSGSFVASDKRQELTKVIDAHPAWSETQMTDAVTAAGAKFGPNQKDALLARFPASQLEPIFGKIEIRSARFEFRRNSEQTSHSVMEWSIRFRTSSTDSNGEYFASVEPFEGKVVMLGHTPFPSEDK